MNAVEDRRISWARIIACFMVVLLHATQNAGSFGDGWWAAHFWNSLTRACVPAFLMISGATLLGREQPLGMFISRRLLRVVPALLVWSGLYLWWLSIPLVDWPSRIMAGPTMYHLWYFYAILGLYAFVPVLNHFVLRASPAELLWYLALWAAFSSILPFMNSVQLAGCGDLSFGQFNALWHVGAFVGYSGYMVLGAAIYRGAAARLDWRAGLFLYGAGTAITFFGGAWHGQALGAPCTLLYLYLSPNVILQAIGLFILCRGLRPGAPSRFVSLLAGATTGIYGLHVLGIDRLAAWTGLSSSVGSPWLTTLAAAVAVFAGCFVVIAALRMVRVLRIAI